MSTRPLSPEFGGSEQEDDAEASLLVALLLLLVVCETQRSCVCTNRTGLTPYRPGQRVCTVSTYCVSLCFVLCVCVCSRGLCTRTYMSTSFATGHSPNLFRVCVAKPERLPVKTAPTCSAPVVPVAVRISFSSCYGGGCRIQCFPTILRSFFRW